jgi:endoglucanase
MRFSNLLSGAFLAGVAQAQVGAYGQCGGISWTGGTTCVSGYYCYYSNPYYSQCIPGTATTTASSAASTKATTTTSSHATTTSTSAVAGATGFRWLGVDESGPEFGSGTYPGVWGVNFIFPSLTSIDVRDLQHHTFGNKTNCARRSWPRAITSSDFHLLWSAWHQQA